MIAHKRKNKKWKNIPMDKKLKCLSIEGYSSEHAGIIIKMISSAQKVNMWGKRNG